MFKAKSKKKDKSALEPYVNYTGPICRGNIFYKDKNREILKRLDRGDFTFPNKGYLFCVALIYPKTRTIKFKRVENLKKKEAAGLDKVCNYGTCRLKMLLDDYNIKKVGEVHVIELAEKMIKKVEEKYPSSIIRKMEEVKWDDKDFISSEILGYNSRIPDENINYS